MPQFIIHDCKLFVQALLCPVCAAGYRLKLSHQYFSRSLQYAKLHLPFYAVLQYIHALLFLDRSRTIQAAEYIVSLYLLKFALQTCISTAHSHFIANVRKKSIES